MQLSINFVVGALAAASAVSAHVFRVIPRDAQPVPAPQQHHKRAPAHGFVRRQTGQTEQSVAKLHGGMSKECVQPQAADLNGLEQNLPTEWQIASIINGDQQANKVWGEIKNSGIIPNISPKKDTQNHMGIDQSFTQQSYDKSDPDCWWTYNKCTQPKHKSIPSDLTSCSESDTWGLSFDDGPNCTHNEFYDFLQKNKLRASLMYIGSNVKLHPFHAQRGIADGHDICVHTWSHKYTSTLSNDQVFAELFYTIKAIKGVVGVTPRCWRPPYGDVDDRVRAIAAGLGLRTIVWEADTDDWNIVPGGKSPSSKIDQNYESIIGLAKQSKSPMVLTHEITSGSMDEFMHMYSKIKAAFKNIVPLTACVGATNPYPEKVTYPNFKEFTSGKINATGLPDPNSQKIDGNPQINPTALSKQGSGSYMNPSQKGGSSAAAAGPASFGAIALGVVASMIAFVAI